MTHSPSTPAAGAALDLAGLDAARFTALFGAVYEHSPWIAERAFAKAPFRSAAELRGALYAVVQDASPDEKLALLNAHPELAGREAQEGTLTAASAHEQARAGLGQLSPAQAAELRALNAAYRERFGFPFIICARLNSREAILGSLRARLHNDAAQELQNAIAQVGEIARLRIADLLAGPT